MQQTGDMSDIGVSKLINSMSASDVVDGKALAFTFRCVCFRM